MKKILLWVSQPPGRGWSSRLGQNPKFVKGNIFGAPLIMHYRYFRNSRRKRMYFTTIIEEQRDPRIHDLGPFLAKIRKFQAKLGNFMQN